MPIYRTPGVPARGHDVVLRKPPDDQTRPARIIVASYADAQTAQQQAEQRNAADTRGYRYYAISQEAKQ